MKLKLLQNKSSKLVLQLGYNQKKYKICNSNFKNNLVKNYSFSITVKI